MAEIAAEKLLEEKLTTDEARLKLIVGANIVRFRKQANLTQLELAQKLNYSDKAVSKWERAEALPDIYVLKRLADLFKLRVDDLLHEVTPKKIYIGISIEKRIIIPIMACLIIFFLALLAFGAFIMLNAPIQDPWLCFIYAMPASALSFLIFTLVWKKYVLITVSGSVLMWSLALLLFISIQLPNKFIFFIIALPLQAIIVLWCVLKNISARRKRRAGGR